MLQRATPLGLKALLRGLASNLAESILQFSHGDIGQIRFLFHEEASVELKIAR